MKILGIDPGINNLAFALLEVENGSYKLRDWKTISTKKQRTLSEKLVYIFDSLKETVENFRPDIIGVEETFAKVYPRAGSRIAQAQAIALLVAGLYNIPVKTCHPTEIKKFFTQYGRAGKKDISHVLNLFLKENLISSELNSEPDSHKMDALAITLILALELQI
jgi:crossover junction endodeoxyribonuclease RuvC